MNKNKDIDLYINQNFFTTQKHDKEIISKSIIFINKIRNALATNSEITICGDYDVDAFASCVMLEEMIRDYAKAKKREAKINVFIPSREDGYGLQLNTFNELRSRDSYIFTLDNGTHREFLNNLQKESHEKIFIIDHHPNGDTKNMSFVLNPNSDGKLIISTAYLLDYVYQILLQVDKEYIADRYKYADLVAMSLVSDMADLNNIRVRHLIQKGLQQIKKKERTLYRHLFPVKGSEITFNNIAFDLNPRLNSIGRLSSNPKDAVTILKYKDETNRATKAIEYLNSVNNLRKDHLNLFIEEAINEMKKREPSKNNIIYYYNKDIPFGLNGLVAQKIYEIYNVPTLVASQSKINTKIKGSGRGFGIKYILNMFQDRDIFTYGGHNDALGFEIKEHEVFNRIINRINSTNIPIQKEFKHIILKEDYTIQEYKDFSKELSLKSNTIPFKQKFYAHLEDVDVRIKKVFKNNFCYLEIKDNKTNEKINYFTRHNVAKEIVENKETFFVSVYAEFNNKKTQQDFSGDILLEKDIKQIEIEQEQIIEINL